jgi:tetratricopeptide (TPR) repeat protein
MAMSSGDTATLRARAVEALSLHRQLGDTWGVAYAQMMLGNAAALDKDNEAGLCLFEEAARGFREVGDQHYTVGALNAIAHFHGELGDLERERELHEEVLQLARAYANERMVARALYSLSWHSVIEGRPQDSKAIVEEAMATYRRLGEITEIGMGLRRFAWALAAERRAQSATQLYARAEALREEIGESREAWVVDMDKKTLALIHAELDDTAFAEAWERGRTLTIDEAVALALESEAS